MNQVKILSLILGCCCLAGCFKQPDFEQVQINLSPSAVSEDVSDGSKPIEAEAVVESADNNQSQSAVIGSEDNPRSAVAAVPTELELAVAFAPQAPFGRWDGLHQEACEEASMIIVSRYFSGQSLNHSIMEEEIQKLIAWEAAQDYRVDLTATEAVAVLADYFGLSARVEPEATIDRIKYELSLGNLIIVPAAGRELGNPYFQTPGPIYHMLVIKGYNQREFITNDVGTKRGDGFRYPYDRLIAAIHDWDHRLAEDGMTDEEIAQGARVLIVVEKPRIIL